MFRLATLKVIVSNLLMKCLEWLLCLLHLMLLDCLTKALVISTKGLMNHHFISSLFDLVRALTFSCSLRSFFMTQLSLGRRDSMVITSSSSPSESELVTSSFGASFFFLVPFLGATFLSSESESVASSHVPFLGSCFFFLAPPLAMKHMGG